MNKYNLKTRIFKGGVGSGKTTAIIKELEKLLTENPDIKVIIYEDLDEIIPHFDNKNIKRGNIEYSNSLDTDADLIVIGAVKFDNFVIILRHYLYSFPIWMEVNNSNDIEIINCNRLMNFGNLKGIVK